RSRRSVAVAQAQAQAAGEWVRELGSYRLLRRLGSGGMGEVWVGEHRMLARRAAIKLVLRRALAGRSEDQIQVTIARFQREARATASLRSRNTIQVYDFGVSAGGDFYYVMELLEGYDLHALVLNFGPPPLGRIVHLARQVCRSLAEAHDRGLVHRDIKPANIFCSELGGEGDVVKVLDFGMVIAPAVANGRLTSPDMAQGTPSFMAPEQARGLPIGPHADLYALGCVLHVLITGDDVFPQSHPVAAALAHVNESPAPLSRRTKRTIPAALERLVMACLAKNPADRPADARVMEAALAAIEIPSDERWDDAAIRAWWQAHPPRRLGVELVAERMDLQPRFVPAPRSETEPVGKTPAS
ncbi:MAG: serine/threonine protein kinase, partial [Planctomycetes bacterium]|nr:serine/threonine protein kinase [Planctomycetota bacterium]